MLIVMTLALFGCAGGQEPPEPQLETISGVSFSDAAFTYDGTEKEITVNGNIPSGVSVSYEHNKATDAGSYNAKAILSGEGYKSLTLNATLIINKADISGVSFSDAEFTYDGGENEISVSGTLPSGVTVAYENNKAVNAGVYSAKAILSSSNYNTLTLNAELKINKATISGITADASQSIDGDGEMHLPVFSGTVPSGVNVNYFVDGVEKPNGISSIGTHNFKIIFTSSNYETLELPVTYKIKINPVTFAKNVIDAFGTTPSPWEFLPESFASQYHTVDSLPSYDKFVNVSSIPTNGIGKQMNVVYSLLNKTSSALGYVNTVMNVMGGIKTLYTEYLDSDPTDYQTYSNSIGGFNFTIAIDEDSYLISASVESVLVKIFANTTEKTYGASVKLSETTVLKYTVFEEKLLIAMDILDTVTTQIEFVRNGESVIGMLYEYVTAGDKQITATSAMLEVGEKYTVVIGTKGDFLPGSVSRNCEIYDNQTGKFVGSEVREDEKGTVYNTYWFPLHNLEGLDTIKKLDKQNIYNSDTIYINGIDSDTLHTTLMGYTYLSKMGARRYDIEFKTVYGYVYDADSEEYKAESYEIPMLFIQEEVIGEFEKDFRASNEAAVSGKDVELTVKATDLSAISRGYNVLLPLYDELKDAVTHEMISNYCKQ